MSPIQNCFADLLVKFSFIPVALEYQRASVKR